MNRIIFSVLLAALLGAGAGRAQMPGTQMTGGMSADSVQAAQPFVPHDVFDDLAAADPATGAVVRVYQDTLINRLLMERQLVYNNRTVSGFRVQVFSSNRQQTAKAEAFRIKDMVKEKFPDRGVYESYSSPFWKVRVGDFRTREEAQGLLAELMQAFPAMRHEMYIVPDNISVAGTK